MINSRMTINRPTRRQIDGGTAIASTASDGPFEDSGKVAIFVPLPRQHRIIEPVPGREIWPGFFDRKSIISGISREFCGNKIAN